MRPTKGGRSRTNHLAIVEGEGLLGISRIRGDGNVLGNVLLYLGDGAGGALLHLPVALDAAAHLLLVLVEAIGGDEHHLGGSSGFDPGLGYTVVDRLDDDGRFLRGHLYGGTGNVSDDIATRYLADPRR